MPGPGRPPDAGYVRPLTSAVRERVAVGRMTERRYSGGISLAVAAGEGALSHIAIRRAGACGEEWDSAGALARGWPPLGALAPPGPSSLPTASPSAATRPGGARYVDRREPGDILDRRRTSASRIAPTNRCIAVAVSTIGGRCAATVRTRPERATVRPSGGADGPYLGCPPPPGFGSSPSRLVEHGIDLGVPRRMAANAVTSGISSTASAGVRPALLPWLKRSSLRAARRSQRVAGAAWNRDRPRRRRTA